MAEVGWSARFKAYPAQNVNFFSCFLSAKVGEGAQKRENMVCAHVNMKF